MNRIAVSASSERTFSLRISGTVVALDLTGDLRRSRRVPLFVTIPVSG
jgi:hypothetical protein